MSTSTPSPTPQAQPKPVEQPAPAAKKSRSQLLIYLDADTLAQLRGAAPHVLAARHYRSMSEWVADVLERELAQQAKDLNNGKPWPLAKPGSTLSTGRR